MPFKALLLVTNATSRLEHDLARPGIAKEFERVVNSSAVGVAKPDPKIFEIALLRAGEWDMFVPTMTNSGHSSEDRE